MKRLLFLLRYYLSVRLLGGLRWLSIVAALVLVMHTVGNAEASGFSKGKRVSLVDQQALKTGAFSGVLLGAYVNPDNTWNGDEQQKVLAFESMIGRKIAIDMRYYSWRESWTNWPTALDTWDAQEKRIPMLTWGSPDSKPTSDAINAGLEDPYIRDRARAAKNLGPYFVRPLWEMNGDWSIWNGSFDGNSAAGFVKAWQRIHRIFQEEGATNAIFVWSPNASSVPGDSWNHWTNYYPGDAYVDWVGMDGYNWGPTQPWHTWESFSAIFDALYRDYANRKPIMVAETASTEIGGNKADWIRQAHADIKKRMPGIKAFVWFDSNKETDWRVDSSPESLTAFRALASDPYFGVSLR